MPYSISTRSFHFRRLVAEREAFALHFGRALPLSWTEARKLWRDALAFVFFV